MRTRVKICGIARPEDAAAAVEAGADALGFVFWPDSPRFVAPEEVASIQGVPPSVARVGVFVNQSPGDVSVAVRRAGLTAVQLHGDEVPTDYQRCGAVVIKAVELTDRRSLESALALPSSVTVLVDGAAGARRGGAGIVADWALARKVASARPILLAGGLTAENVGEAIRAVRPWAVDVSSGVEVRPGVKDPARIQAILRRVAEVDREISDETR